jgi:spermidine synthase
MRILTEMHAAMGTAGFADARTLFFPQPIYPSGWWSATMASTDLSLVDFRIEDARRKHFDTLYYNAEIHRASLAQPEFFRRALAQGAQ